MNRPGLEDYFIKTGFYDLLPIALKLAKTLDYDHSEMIEAICKVHDKFNQYPPTKNRIAWFRLVFEEKLKEARADILAFKATTDHLREKAST
ncbi:hypothetical protein [Desulfosporosinus sp. BICA1-9]|uniref:hypothetical protein n=1 Tax=Desulfosporosinus sp. BICA1-9 TaxID=1531958 RepID=UPI00054BDEF7|nr:hypothetical protein [Desulfosporosinus sp. BICA1-9]KJS50585.1 MAG: hypothetical protein VR66_02225 [Peptococcaceae bacterium BRH_c23]KJS82852.1 MAG: hypothetical protein JL57_23870 [Desulfosporosinus sp. BICA1-9]